jgi:2-polyprenyl-6-methoxyphenol hydroxylase-like FAD-dependent oxidoreductase
MAPSPRIATLGAGPAGLTLASLLTLSHIPYTVYDLRTSPSTSPDIPSGSLDLHASSGLLALSHCGLLPKFQALKSDCSEDFIIADKIGNVHWRDDGMEASRPEVARNDLTSLLLSSIPGERIKWGYKVLSVAAVKSKSAR